MYRSRILLIALYLGASCDFNAAQLKEVEHTQSVAVELSSKDPNIISVDNDRIKQYSALKGLAVASIDADYGFINIKPVVTQEGRPFSLIVLTEKGNRFTLIANPKKIPAQDIILNPVKQITHASVQNSEDKSYSALIQAMMQDKELAGYSKVKSDDPRGFDIKNYFSDKPELSLIGLYKGEKSNGEVILFQNNTDEDIALHENGLYTPEVLALSLSSYEVKPGETAAIYRVVSHG
ncbi:MAG: type-F conjugative transfer system secretin TraK [Rickettsiaceae bacterium]|nr:type-F conjugative transfer system secretin TraK [Rickettsiaceae bacterium]